MALGRPQRSLFHSSNPSACRGSHQPPDPPAARTHGRLGGPPAGCTLRLAAGAAAAAAATAGCTLRLAAGAAAAAAAGTLLMPPAASHWNGAAAAAAPSQQQRQQSLAAPMQPVSRCCGASCSSSAASRNAALAKCAAHATAANAQGNHRGHTVFPAENRARPGTQHCGAAGRGPGHASHRAAVCAAAGAAHHHP